MNAPRSVFPTTPPTPTSRKGLWLSVIAVVVVLAIAGVLVVVLNRGTTNPTTAPAATSATATTPSPTSAATGGAGFTGTTVDKLNKPVQLPANPAGQILPQTGKTPADTDGVPDGLMWQKIYDLPIVPFSTSDGPTKIKDGVAQGWAHTPQGAALAATSILNTWLLAPDAASTVVQKTLLSGTEADIAARTKTNRPLRMVGLTDPDLGPGAVAGVQVDTYTNNFARISYGAGPVVDDTNPDGFYQVSTLSVTWQDGTWKLIVTPTTPDRGEQRTTIAGMTPWTD
ncbi:hypothetical protein ACQ7HM_21065 [Williamsia sp. MIQD14]|uniref:hypothetical protein n=1 Tax=Williamsia sp. MIQD14 TaxID=3425703 RepID=UPI003DA07768